MTVTLEEIRTQLDEIIGILDDKIAKITIAAPQIKTYEGLSDIDKRLGLVQAGEFRAGNGADPSFGFSGVRVGYPAFRYSNEDWHIVGVDNDILQFGLRASDGVAVAGAGNVILSSDGIVVINAADVNDPFIILKNSTGETVGGIFTNSSSNLEIFAAKFATGQRKLVLQAQSNNGAQLSTIELIADESGSGIDWVTLNADWVGISGNITTTGTSFYTGTATFNGAAIFNGNSGDFDVTINGDTVSAIFKADASLDRVQFGNDHYFATRSSADKNTYINEANQDMDTYIRSVNSDYMFFLDASADRIGILKSAPGYTLDVGGDVNVASGSNYKINGSNMAIPNIYPTNALGNSVPASVTRYMCPFVDGVPDATERAMVVLRAGTVKNFYLRQTGTQPASGSLVCYVRKNVATDEITITIPAGSAGAQNRSETSTSFSVAAGDFVGFKFVNNATAASTTLGFVAVEVIYDQA